MSRSGHCNDFPMPGALSLPHVPRSLITRARAGLMGVSLIGVRLVLSWG